jgi:hypothetical protein
MCSTMGVTRRITPNIKDGMFTKLFQPVLNRIYPCAIEEVKHSKQKELRIIDTLEPVLNQHKLIVDPAVIKEDLKVEPQYQLFYQLTRLTKERGSLAHDDRLDALAMAVAYWVECMAQDVDDAIQRQKEELLQAELDKFADHVLGKKSSNKWVHLGY